MTAARWLAPARQLAWGVVATAVEAGLLAEERPLGWSHLRFPSVAEPFRLEVERLPKRRSFLQGVTARWGVERRPKGLSFLQVEVARLEVERPPKGLSFLLVAVARLEVERPPKGPSFLRVAVG